MVLYNHKQNIQHKNETKSVSENRPVSYTHLDVYKRQDQNIISAELQIKRLKESQLLQEIKRKKTIPNDKLLSLIHI